MIELVMVRVFVQDGVSVLADLLYDFVWHFELVSLGVLLRLSFSIDVGRNIETNVRLSLHFDSEDNYDVLLIVC